MAVLNDGLQRADNSGRSPRLAGEQSRRKGGIVVEIGEGIDMALSTGWSETWLDCWLLLSIPKKSDVLVV